MENKNIIKITDENGIENEMEVIHYFTLESNKKDYVVYTNNEEDEQGNVLVYASECFETDDSVEFIAITDENILSEVTNVMMELIQE